MWVENEAENIRQGEIQSENKVVKIMSCTTYFDVQKVD